MSDLINLLGQTARDKVTGFEGVVVSVSFDLFGCVQAALSPPVDKDGKRVDSVWYDVNRLQITKAERVMPVPEFATKPQEHKHGPAEKPARKGL